MDKFLSVFGEYVSEKTIEKSKFITYSAHVEGDENAKAFLDKIRSLHPAATHVCYAYCADKAGNLLRFSDDGEPQGTAGMPILEVIKNKKLYETAVAVVRYFGGIKLGAGGLTRAYSSCAAENLNGAAVKLWQICKELKISVSYAESAPLQQFIGKSPISLLKQDYGADVSFSVAVKKDEAEDFISRLTDFLIGKVKISEVNEYYFAFDM